MAELSNQKHEKFAQAVAAGQSACAAYVTAGYEADSGNATRLAGKADVQARVLEIQRETAACGQVSKAELLAFYASIIRTPVGAITKDHQLCEEYSVVQTKHGTHTRTKMPGKIEAAREIAKLCGFYEPEIVGGKMEIVIRKL